MSSLSETRIRRESHTRPKDAKPLFSTEVLSLDRKKLPQTQPKKRKRPPPATPALSFDPKQNRIRSGRQDPSPPTPSSSCISPADTSNGSSYEEPAPSPYLDAPQEPKYIFQSQPMYDPASHKRPRVFNGPSHSYSGSPSAEMNPNLVEYDSPSSSSPATSDQSPTHPSDNAGYDRFDCQMPPTAEELCSPYSCSGYGGVSDGAQFYTRESGGLNYPMSPYPESNYAGAVPSVAPPYGVRGWFPPS